MALALAEANRFIKPAIARARELNAEVSVTVCDDEDRLIALNRMDEALATSNRDSIGKTIAVAASGRPSAEIEATVDLRFCQVLRQAPRLAGWGRVGRLWKQRSGTRGWSVLPAAPPP